MRVREYLDQNPDGAFALAGRLAFLKHERRGLVRARRHMMAAAYLAAAQLRNIGKEATRKDLTMAITSYAEHLAPVLLTLVHSAMAAAARLGSYGIERVDLAQRSAGRRDARDRYTRETNKLSKGFASRSFKGRDLVDRCQTAAEEYISNIEAEAVRAFVATDIAAAAQAIEEYAAFGLRDKSKPRNGEEESLPDNPGWQTEALLISELNYAYSAGIKAAGNIYEGYIGVRWMLSPLHKITDICDDYATLDLHGLGPGVYPKGTEPDYPHPQCRCWLAPVFGGPNERG